MHFKINKIVILIFLCCSFNTTLFSQITFPDSTKKTNYLAVANSPTLRTFLYGVGIERYQKINKTLAFTSSFTFGVLPYIPNFQALVFSACLQPFHLLIGKGRFKFETGVSVSYHDVNFNNASSASGFTPIFVYNAYFGGRYILKSKPLHLRFGYAPFYNLYGFDPLGFELGAAWVLHKSKNAIKRKELKERNIK